MGLKDAILLLVVLGAIFADSPPPMRPYLQVNLMEGNHSYIGEANATYVCSQNSSSISLTCLNGTCTNTQSFDYRSRTWYDYGDPCFYSTGRLTVQAAGKSIITGEINLEQPGEYTFSLDLASGKLTPESNPQPDEGFCGPALLLLSVAMLAFAAKRG